MSRKPLVPEAKITLNQMKGEIANDLGLRNYDTIDKGALTSRQNGYVGGYMNKKLISIAKQQFTQDADNTI